MSQEDLDKALATIVRHGPYAALGVLSHAAGKLGLNQTPGIATSLLGKYARTKHPEYNPEQTGQIVAVMPSRNLTSWPTVDLVLLTRLGTLAGAFSTEVLISDEPFPQSEEELVAIRANQRVAVLPG